MTPIRAQEICLPSSLKKITIDKCRVLKGKICDMIKSGKLAHLYGSYAMLTCDKIKLGTPITNGVAIHRVYFSNFKENYKDIYVKLVQSRILYPKKAKKKENLGK